MVAARTACFKPARGAKPSRRVRKDLRAAFAANSDYSDHCLRLDVCPHFVLRKILSKITPALKTRISPIYTNALTVSVLVDDFVVAFSQLTMNFHAKTYELKNLFFVKQLRHKWIEARISRIHTNWISSIRDNSWNSCRAFVYFMSTRESQQSNNATRFRYRQESQQY